MLEIPGALSSHHRLARWIACLQIGASIVPCLVPVLSQRAKQRGVRGSQVGQRLMGKLKWILLYFLWEVLLHVLHCWTIAKHSVLTVGEIVTKPCNTLSVSNLKSWFSIGGICTIIFVSDEKLPQLLRAKQQLLKVHCHYTWPFTHSIVARSSFISCSLAFKPFDWRGWLDWAHLLVRVNENQYRYGRIEMLRSSLLQGNLTSRLSGGSNCFPTSRQRSTFGTKAGIPLSNNYRTGVVLT